MTSIRRNAKIIAISLGIGLSTFLMLSDVNASSAYVEQQVEEDVSIKTENNQQVNCYCKFIPNTENNQENIIENQTGTKAETNIAKVDNKEENKDIFIYLKDINMAKEHQEYLYNICKEKGLDYLKILALIKHESQFNSKAIGNGSNYGYMQINKVNHKNLAKTLQTKNAPLDPYVNIRWGTHILSELYKYWRNQGISSEVKEGEIFSKLDRYVLSSYNKGIAGFKKYGEATDYINKVEKEYMYLKNLINNTTLKYKEETYYTYISLLFSLFFVNFTQ